MEEAERDLVCESMLGMVQPGKRAGIGFGEWKKPWEKMNFEERRKAALERVQENLQKERVVEYGSLELQSGWARWREDVLSLDLSWNSLFKMGDSMVGFILRAVYGTLVTPSLAVKWDEAEDGMCKLCRTEVGTIQHILSGCKVALEQGRYTWRHDKVLNQIRSQVAYHLDKRVNNPKRSISLQSSKVEFVSAGAKVKGIPRRRDRSGMGILTEARDWVLLADVNGQLKFPSEVATTRLRPDLIIYSTSTKRIVWWELTCPSEERISAAHDFVVDGERVISRRIIANKFNAYFTSLANNLNQEVLSSDIFHVQPLTSFTQFMSKSVDSSIFLEETNTEEVSKIIHNLENRKASDIPIAVIKRPAHLISKTLSRLYNNCMHSGLFPSVFKTGKVIPIYKKDNKECIENYRPVSILPVFGKIFEKIIYNRLYKFFTSRGILHDEQFGFRRGHSTTHALHKSVDFITKSMSDGKHVLGIFIDLSKAFDTLDHQILLHKLFNYGIRGPAHALLTSYLNDRQQYVDFNGVSSDILGIKYGVPQGSILGPLLFLLYMNDIVNCYVSPNVKFVLYADDTNIFVVGPSKESTFHKANEVLDYVTTFMRCNLLHINMSKCCYIHFKPPYESDETCARVRPYADEADKSRSIFINGTCIQKVTSTKFLGIIIDDKLNWKPHLKYLTNKLRSITGAICRIRKSVPADLYLKIYNALFESHLTYGITVWGVSLKDQPDDKLFIIQKHCIRVLFEDLDAYLAKTSTCARTRPYGKQKLGNLYYQKEHTKPIFNRLQLLSVQSLFKYFSITELYKIIKFRSPYSLYKQINISKRDTSFTIILPSKTETFLYKASKLWNDIYKKIFDLKVGLCTPVDSIKRKAKLILLDIQSRESVDQWTPKNFCMQLPAEVSTSLSSPCEFLCDEVMVV